jgi:ComF family protein
MPFTRFCQQSHNPMSDRLNASLQKHLAESPSGSPEHYAYASALFFYHEEAGYKNIPKEIKYGGNAGAGRHFGEMLGMKLASSTLWQDADLVIPVPLHWTRKWKRGYNQAEIIAGAIAATMGIGMRTDILKRCRKTATQTKLDTLQKEKNVYGAFQVDKDAALAAGEVRHIILVDDVFTSGSTAGACFQALREVFPPSVRISVATLGFVGGA